MCNIHRYLCVQIYTLVLFSLTCELWVIIEHMETATFPDSFIV